MFETVAPEFFGKRSRNVFYESLPVSVGIHLLLAAGVAYTTLAYVAFPDQPPRLITSYVLADAIATQAPSVPEPPAPLPPPKAHDEPAEPNAPVLPQQVFAPDVIPDLLPVSKPKQIVTLQADLAAAVPQGVEGGVPGGVIGGDLNSGVAGGVVNEGRKVGGGLLMSDGRVHFARNFPLPMYMVHQEKPEYPEAGRQANWEDDVVVRYVVGIDGRVKELSVIEHAERKMFETATLTAIATWRFRPLMIDNEPREVVHELLVRFRLTAR